MSLTTPERNLSNTPALKAIYDAMRAVENCGGPVALTNALNVVAAIGPHVHGFMDTLATLTAEVERKQAALEEATSIIDAYAAQHPRWIYDGHEQDPMGAHKWLELFAARRAVLPVGGEG